MPLKEGDCANDFVTTAFKCKIDFGVFRWGILRSYAPALNFESLLVMSPQDVEMIGKDDQTFGDFCRSTTT